jgi:hypothetical protein
VPPEHPPGVPPSAGSGEGRSPKPIAAPGNKSGQFICYKTGQIKKLATSCRPETLNRKWSANRSYRHNQSP